MSKFHSVVTRRDFMKALGLAGAGLGAAAAAAPVFHDVDEVISAPTSFMKRPWWIKERDLFEPTTEVDWDIIKRFDRRLNGQTQYTFENYPEFWSRFKLILVGCTEHLLLDLTMHPWEETGLYLLYPLKIPYSFGLVWSDYTWFPLYGIIVLSIASILWLAISNPFQHKS